MCLLARSLAHPGKLLPPCFDQYGLQPALAETSWRRGSLQDCFAHASTPASPHSPPRLSPQRPHHAQPQTRNLAACPPNRSITYSSSETSTPHPSEWPPAREPRATPLARFKSLLTSIGALRRSDRSRTSASTSPRIGCRLPSSGPLVF